jgi:tetratricopeptide (TPR) repeat protein
LAVYQEAGELVPDHQEKAEHHASRALELHHNLPEAHSARGYLLWTQAKNYAYREAIAAFQKSLELNPNVWTALTVSWD